MFTVIVGLDASGKSSTRSPLGSRYSVMPSTAATFAIADTGIGLPSFGPPGAGRRGAAFGVTVAIFGAAAGGAFGAAAGGAFGGDAGTDSGGDFAGSPGDAAAFVLGACAKAIAGMAAARRQATRDRMGCMGRGAAEGMGIISTKRGGKSRSPKMGFAFD
jgi:hypothetical protein